MLEGVPRYRPNSLQARGPRTKINHTHRIARYVVVVKRGFNKILYIFYISACFRDLHRMDTLTPLTLTPSTRCGDPSGYPQPTHRPKNKISILQMNRPVQWRFYQPKKQSSASIRANGRRYPADMTYNHNVAQYIVNLLYAAYYLRKDIQIGRKKWKIINHCCIMTYLKRR